MASTKNTESFCRIYAGLSSTYFSFAVVGVLAVISMYLTVPETKGRTLEEIEVGLQCRECR